MIETSNGRLRLRCDAEECPRTFSPKRPLPEHPDSAQREIRTRAWCAGWLVDEFLGGTPVGDRCPECRP